MGVCFVADPLENHKLTIDLKLKQKMVGLVLLLWCSDRIWCVCVCVFCSNIRDTGSGCKRAGLNSLRRTLGSA